MNLTAGRTPHERERQVLASTQLSATVWTGLPERQLLSFTGPSPAFTNCPFALTFDGGHPVGMGLGVLDGRFDLFVSELWVHFVGNLFARLALPVLRPDVEHADAMSLESRLAAEKLVLDDRCRRV